MLSMILSVLSVSKNGTGPAPPSDANMCTKASLKCGSVQQSSTTYMVPSSIYYIHSGSNNVLAVGSAGQDIVDVSRKILHGGQLPKLQVVEKDGCWFTLNNAQLDLCRILERDGKCTKVKVDIVPLSCIPRVVRSMMMVPTGDDRVEADGSQPANSDPSRTTAKGYERLEQNEGVEDPDKYHVTDSEAEESCSESSDFVDSDSECDWSDEDPETSDVDSTETDASQSTDDERECLL